MDGLRNFSELDRQRDYAAFVTLMKSIEDIKTSDRTFRKLWFKKEACHG